MSRIYIIPFFHNCRVKIVKQEVGSDRTVKIKVKPDDRYTPYAAVVKNPRSRFIPITAEPLETLTSLMQRVLSLCSTEPLDASSVVMWWRSFLS